MEVIDCDFLYECDDEVDYCLCKHTYIDYEICLKCDIKDS